MTRCGGWARVARIVAVGLGIAGLGVLAGQPAQATDDEALEQVLQILLDEGLLDEERHEELAAQVRARAERRSWLDRISVWGDFRLRYENFLFHRDSVAEAMGENLPDRHRVRYRGRLNLSGEVNDYATAYVRLVSGDDDPRSTNQTLGSGPDFDTDDVRFDLAYLTLTPTPGGELDCGCLDEAYLALDGGKIPNPFLWKDLGFDSLIFDNDLTFEGAALRFRGESGPFGFFTNGGWFMIDENSAARDPQLAAGQLGGTVALDDGVTLGGRSTFYHYFSLDDDFFDRASDFGNLIDGLARSNRAISILETSAFLELAFSDLFPVLIFGTYAHNFSARSSIATGAGSNDDAWTAGLYVGDKKRAVRVGFAYFRLEANALPAVFIDSDLTDGLTNRDGYKISLQRQLLRNLELVYELYLSNRIREGAPYVDSIAGARRTRMRVDLKVKF